MRRLSAPPSGQPKIAPTGYPVNQGRLGDAALASRDVTDDRDLLATELDRLRAVASRIRHDLTDEAASTQRKLHERDDELRAARTQVRELEALLDRAERERDRAKHAERENYERVTELRGQVRALERRYDRLANRRTVRAALRAADAARPVFRVVRAAKRGGAAPPPTPVDQPEPPRRFDDDERTAAGQRAIEQLLRHTLPPTPRTSGPAVSAVVLNRDGVDHLRRLLPGLEATAYDDLEVVVVDNGSTDGSLAELDRWASRLELTVVRNEDNRSFSEGCNQGVAAANGELVLLLNNDVEPVEPGWLGRMVDTLLASGAGAVGARLLYPHRPGLDNAGDAAFPDLTLQHGGIRFAHGNEGPDPRRGVDGMPRPRHVGKGGEPLGDLRTVEVPVATAACVLLRRSTYEEAGGLDEGYVYGTEDVDLCLTLRAAGHAVLVCGEAVLWHHEFGTQNVAGAAFKGENRRRNRARFLDRWGPHVTREVLLDRIRAARWWSPEPLRVAFAGGGALAGVDALGWEVARDPADPTLDAVVVRSAEVDLRSLPRHLVTVGWVEGDAEAWLDAPWFDDLDVVVVRDDGDRQRVVARSVKAPLVAPTGLPDAAVLRDALLRWVEATRVAILVSTPSWDVAEVWGDTHYARGVQRQLERRGLPCRVVLRDDFDAPWLSQADVVLHLLGLTEHRTRSGQLNVLWNISHPELATPELCDRYDVCFVASDRSAEALGARASVPVHALHQATDAERFAPDPTGPHHELLFVANSRRTRRRIVDDLTPTRHDLAIYGGEWFPELVDPRHVRGEVVRNVELPAYYTSADVVLNDHWPEMLAHGFISNRLYDALAAGAFVLSDPIDGLEEEFDGGVVTYRDRDDLAEKVARYLADPEARRRHVDAGRRAVLRRHTFAHRVETMLAVLEPALAGRAHAGRPIAPVRPVIPV